MEYKTKDKLEGFFISMSLIFFSLFAISVFGQCQVGPPPPSISGIIMLIFLALSIINFAISVMIGTSK